MALKDKRFELWDVDSWVLIDRDVDMAAFFKLNEVSEEEKIEINALTVGHSWYFGGGAAPLCALRRVE